jgi:hypothetical protein
VGVEERWEGSGWPRGGGSGGGRNPRGRHPCRLTGSHLVVFSRRPSDYFLKETGGLALLCFLKKIEIEYKLRSKRKTITVVHNSSMMIVNLLKEALNWTSEGSAMCKTMFCINEELGTCFQKSTHFCISRCSRTSEL